MGEGHERQRAGDRKPNFHNAGMIIGQVSRVYGYSLLISMFICLFLACFSSLPLTKWDDEDGLPRANVALVSYMSLARVSTKSNSSIRLDW